MTAVAFIIAMSITTGIMVVLTVAMCGWTIHEYKMKKQREAKTTIQ